MKKRCITMMLLSLLMGVFSYGCSAVEKVKTSFDDTTDKTSDEKMESALQAYTDYSDACGSYSCNYIYRNKSMEFLSYLEAKDKDSIKAMMTQELLTAQKDIDEMIDKMFEIYQGPYLYHTIPTNPGYGEGGGDAEGGDGFFIVTEKKTYYCYLGFHYQDPKNHDVGLKAVAFGTIGYLGNDMQTGYRDSYVSVSDVSGDGFVRIGVHVYEMNPNASEVSLDEVKKWTSRNYQEFVEQFGEPLVNDTRLIYYKIKGEEDLYLELFLYDDEIGNINHIYSLEIMDVNMNLVDTILESSSGE